jgi:hypothetical protein
MDEINLDSLRCCINCKFIYKIDKKRGFLKRCRLWKAGNGKNLYNARENCCSEHKWQELELKI